MLDRPQGGRYNLNVIVSPPPQQVGLTMSERGGRRTVADSTAPLGDKLAYRVEHRAGETCGEPEG